MQVQSDNQIYNNVIDDIELNRMQSSDDEDQSQHVPLTTNILATKSQPVSRGGFRKSDEVSNAILKLRGKENGGGQSQHLAPTAALQTNPYVAYNGYRSRDEVSNAILKLGGKKKQAQYAKIQAQRAKLPQRPQRDVSRASCDATGGQMLAVDRHMNALHIVSETKPPFSAAALKSKQKQSNGLLRALLTPLTPCGICVSDTQLPDFGDVEQEMLVEETLEKKKAEEEAANHTRNVHGLKIETSSQFLSPPPEDCLSPLQGEEEYLHDAPCNVVQPMGSMAGCSTITTSSSIRGSERGSIMSVVGKGSSRMYGVASAITSQTQSASFSCRSSQECDTFGSSSSDDSDYTLTIASSNSSSFAVDSYALSSYASMPEDDTYASVLEDDTMDYYGTSLSGSSSSGSEN